MLFSRFVRAHCAIGREGLLREITQSFLQPACCHAIGLEFRVQLISDIGAGDCVGDLRRPHRVARSEADLDDTAYVDLARLELVLKCRDQAFRAGSASVSFSGRNRCKNEDNGPDAVKSGSSASLS